MACAKCDFYLPKQSTAALLLEGKTHLLRLLQEIPLGKAEQAAVEDGVSALRQDQHSGKLALNWCRVKLALRGYQIEINGIM
jgi:hypothetical protein